MNHLDKIKNVLLSTQRNSREQGLSAQTLLELGDAEAFIMLAYDAVGRRSVDGRLAYFPNHIAITDSAAVGEAVLRAYELTDDTVFKTAAEKMLEYYMIHAPHTEDGIICSSKELMRISVDACYTLPPFLAVMNELIEAVKQLVGYMFFLRDEESGLLFHTYDTNNRSVINKRIWATGNGFALLGISRVLAEAERQNANDLAQMLRETGLALLESILKFQLSDGLFYDMINDKSTFKNALPAMMTAAFIYKEIYEKRLDKHYIKYADKVYNTVKKRVDDFGIIRSLTGASSISCESQAAYIMMEAWRGKLLY